MQHFGRTLVLLATLLGVASLAGAGEEPRDPTPDEIARLILHGNAGEHALVAAWLEDADRATLRTVFARLRELRQQQSLPASPTPMPMPMPMPARPKGPSTGDEQLLRAEVRVIDISTERAQALLGALRPTPDRTCIPLTAAQAGALMRVLEKSADATVVTAPQLMMRPGQKANVTMLNKISYVRDYKIVKAKDGRVMADPVVDVIQEGVVIDLVGTVNDDGSLVAAFQATWADVKRPIGEFDTEVEGQKLTVQVPELTVARFKAKATLPNGGWALVGGGTPLGADGDAVERVALLKLDRLERPGALRIERPVPAPPPAPRRAK